MDPETCVTYAEEYERITGHAPTAEATDTCSPERTRHLIQDCAC